jgi:hypothetical protein
MSDVLELNCWILSDDSSCVFLISIPSSEVVGILKKAIKDEMKPELNDHATHWHLLDLWKVSSWALLSSDPSMQALVLTIQHF